MVGAGVAEQYQQRWFERWMPETGVNLRTHGIDLVGLSIVGPCSRELLARVSGEDCSTPAFPFMAIRRMEIGLVPCLVGRVSFTGDLGYEIWVRHDHQLSLLHTLRREGASLGVKLFGSRALNSMRLEKNYGSWRTEYRPIYNAFESGLDRFIDFTRPDFVGRDAALRQRGAEPQRRLVTLAVHANDADAVADEPISFHGRVVGWVTSGGYAHGAGRSMAMGYVESAAAHETEGFSVEILGVRIPAHRLDKPLFDADSLRLRG